MATVYSILGDFLTLYAMIDEIETPDAEYEETILGSLECVMDDFEMKADSYGKLIKNIESDI